MDGGRVRDNLAVTMNVGKSLILALVMAACSTPAAPVVTQAPVVQTITPTEAPVAGSGIITFGKPSSLDDETLAINPTKDSFTVGTKDIAWAAEFSEPAGATKLDFIIAKVGSGGTESIRFQDKLDVSNPAFGLMAGTDDLSGFVDRKPGTYVIRILRDTTILAEGKFTLTK